MALFGICESNDVDYVVQNSGENDLDSHNQYIKFYGKELDELLFDPQNFFYYQNHKYLTLSCLKEFKKNRGEIKDMNDLCLIDAFLEHNKSNRRQRLKRAFIRMKRRVVTNVQGLIIRLTHKTGTYDLARNLYHRIKK